MNGLAPLLAGGPFARPRIAELDRAEAFPVDACRALDKLGMARCHVPARHGGALASHAELLRLWRAVARRDLTVAVAYGKTYLGAVSVWVGGSPEQAAALAADVLDGAVVAWGLSERDHGADLLAGEVTAERTPSGGWRLDGEKWPVNNATRGDLVCVLARTDPSGGPRGFSLFLVDKRELPPGAYRCLPKVATHGIRGADISGIAFTAAELPAEALVGAVGEGVEIVLKALQLTRIACAALSLGAADHALDLATEFASQRRLYERALIEVPEVRRTLADARAALTAVEAVSEVAARSVHALTGELSVISAITKAFVPSIVDETLARLGELLGARAFLTEVYADGMFQKVERDHRVAAIFDGSTAVNRSALINQFPALARAWARRRCDAEGLAVATDPGRPLADPGELSLVSTGGCSLVQALPDTVARVRELAPERLAASAGRVLEAAERVHADIAACPPPAGGASAAAFRIAERYELCFAAAACLRFWLVGALREDACLTYLLSRLEGAS